MAEAPAIETTGLSKTYRGGVRALSGLDLRLERGEVLGYLGPNGAGKSTTLRLLLDLIRPTGGSARILGLDVRIDGVEVRRRVGYVPGDLRLFDRLTGREQLDSLARLRGGLIAELRDELCDRFAVVLDRPIRDLSKGNRQKLGLVQAFMHRPEVLVLDEPTSGLDPLLQEEFRRLLRETVDDGRAVFLSSHSLDEVQHVADRVAIIRGGRLVDVDSVEGLREHALRRVTIHFVGAADAAPFAALPAVRIDAVEGTVLRLSVPEATMDAVVKVAGRSTILDFVSEPADLEEIFLTRYREVDDGS
jgi:ABC-2 type transport system ATP-binding protein